MCSEQRKPHRTGLDEEAITWLVRLTSGESSAAMLAEFKQWYGQSPEHAKALTQARQLWLTLGNILPELTTAEIVPFPQKPVTSTRRRLLNTSIAAGLFLALSVGVYSQLNRYDYRTGVGEQRMVALSDGTKIQLDTDTAFNVDYTSTQRHVQLDQGEAYFDVAHNPDKAFVINASFGQIRVLGTAFSVRNDGGNIWVTVTRGRVQVSGGALDKNLYLQANEQVRFSQKDQKPDITHLNAEQELAWRSGQLQFENKSLSEILNELQRYDKRYWIYDESMANQLKLNTVINVHNIGDWLEGLQRTLPVDIQKIGPVIWLRARTH